MNVSLQPDLISFVGVYSCQEDALAHGGGLFYGDLVWVWFGFLSIGSEVICLYKN